MLSSSSPPCYRVLLLASPLAFCSNLTVVPHEPYAYSPIPSALLLRLSVGQADLSLTLIKLVRPYTVSGPDERSSRRF